MEDYWNKMQKKFIETGQYPQQLPIYNQPPPMNNAQQIPKASNPIPIDNENNNPYYPYQASDFQQPSKVEQFDGIIDPKQNRASGQGHYGFRNSNSNGNGKWYDEIKNIINENMSTEAKYLCVGTSIIWLIILIMIFHQF